MSADPGFGIYVHWPFCKSKCPYCDFNSHVREQVDQRRWRDGLLAELAHFAERVPKRNLGSIFFGGGTPSLMPPDTAAAIIDAARTAFPPSPNLEVTLEANPTSVEAARFAAFRAAGVNRVSLGLQALDDASLKFLGRQHSAAEARAALEVAHRHFARVSFDLIYARPGQTREAWIAELKQALSIAGEHLSLYQLTIEPNTGFAGAVARGDIVPLDADPAADLYAATRDVCGAAGMPAYEISNHARPGRECRHNLVYWRYGEYLGLGPGAHGRISDGGGKRATRQLRKPEAWLEAVEAQGHGTEADDPIDRTEQVEELLMMGLRLSEGVPLARIREVSGAPIDAVLKPERLGRLIDGGFIHRDAERLRATAEGRNVLNALLAELLA
ncbi:MAG TPA: radical SAM family heme chaperone HemW [Candidatus Cybelea sp.]|nr:radical SAM family heme chaperone HemW [Candidatus Cybelea sp.]